MNELRTVLTDMFEIHYDWMEDIPNNFKIWARNADMLHKYQLQFETVEEFTRYCLNQIEKLGMDSDVTRHFTIFYKAMVLQVLKRTGKDRLAKSLSAAWEL